MQLASVSLNSVEYSFSNIFTGNTFTRRNIIQWWDGDFISSKDSYSVTISQPDIDKMLQLKIFFLLGNWYE